MDYFCLTVTPMPPPEADHVIIAGENNAPMASFRDKHASEGPYGQYFKTSTCLVAPYGQYGKMTAGVSAFLYAHQAMLVKPVDKQEW